MCAVALPRRWLQTDLRKVAQNGKSAFCGHRKTVSFRRVVSTRRQERLAATLINCFVQPVGDSIVELVDGRPGIYSALAEAAGQMRIGGGVGYDFSSIRPQGAQVKGTQSRAPLAPCHTCACSTAPAKRSSRPALDRAPRWESCCDHPDIELFIHAKDQGDLTTFNDFDRRHR